MMVSIADKKDFSLITNDSRSGDTFAAKEGWPAVELNPLDIESRGMMKHKPGITVARVFQYKKVRKWVDGNRIRVNEFVEERYTTFMVLFKGSYWGKTAPPDTEVQAKPECYTSATSYISEEGKDRCRVF